MLKQDIKFKDFDGNERDQTLYFNLTEAELVDMQVDSEEGIQKDMQDAIASKDMRRLLDFVKMLVHRAYGERDRDGIHFHKSPEITNAFINSAMYSPLLLSLFQDEGARTSAFITGLMPADLVQRAIAQSQGQGNQAAPTRPGLQPQDFLPKQRDSFGQEQPGVNEAPVIGRTDFHEMATPQVQPEDLTEGSIFASSESVQADVPQPFRVREEPMDPEYAEFLRRKAAGEL